MASLTNLFNKWALPPERDFGWKMKPLESAKTDFTIDEDGVFKLTIEHDSICGVTPQMLFWWFNNLSGDMTYKGKLYPKYLVWHPKDHIHWNLIKKTDSKNKIVSCFRIVEAFNRNMNFLVDSTELVEKLDVTGIRLVKRMGATEIFSLQHDFIPDGCNTIYKSQMIVGFNKKLLGTFFNNCIRPFFFTKEMATAWLQHNVEEVGNFEFFFPELYYEEMNRMVKRQRQQCV
jgi:hypothetical protein